MLTAQTELLGVPHHVYFVQVQETANGLEPVKDPAGRLEDVERQLGEGRPQTVELPGLRWALCGQSLPARAMTG